MEKLLLLLTEARVEAERLAEAETDDAIKIQLEQASASIYMEHARILRLKSERVQ